MAICRYCGQKAGWFSGAHAECIQKANNAIEALKTCMADAIIQGKRYSEIKPQLDKTSAESAIPQEQALAAIKEGWSQGAEQRSKAQPIGPGGDVRSNFRTGQAEMRKVTVRFCPLVGNHDTNVGGLRSNAGEIKLHDYLGEFLKFSG